MDKELAREIARLVADQWVPADYITLASLIVLAIFGGIAVYVGPYLAKKAEHRATSEEYLQLKRQLEENTRATQEISLSLAHADWSAREWKSARARKITELLAAVHNTHRWVRKASQMMYQRSLDDIHSDGSSAELKALQLVYFPELQFLVGDFDQKCRQAVIKYAEFIGDNYEIPLADYRRRLAERREEFLEEMRVVYRSLLAIDASVPQLLRAIYGELPTQVAYPLPANRVVHNAAGRADDTPL